MAQVTVAINWNETHQTIDGFGTFEPSSYDWPEPQRSQIMDLAFSQANGIGLTILRTKILPSLEPSPGAWNYTDAAQVWMMKEAVNRSPVKLIASVWTPPAWMKSNNSEIGGFVQFPH
jgi:glucuronoarabinoxylan endo-1,4-beta-xylanase